MNRHQVFLPHRTFVFHLLAIKCHLSMDLRLLVDLRLRQMAFTSSQMAHLPSITAEITIATAVETTVLTAGIVQVVDPLREEDTETTIIVEDTRKIMKIGTIIEGSMTAKGRARASFSSTGDFAVMEIIVAIFMISLNLLVIKQNVSRLLDHKSIINY